MVMKILKRNDQTPLPINDIDRLEASLLPKGKGDVNGQQCRQREFQQEGGLLK